MNYSVHRSTCPQKSKTHRFCPLSSSFLFYRTRLLSADSTLGNLPTPSDHSDKMKMFQTLHANVQSIPNEFRSQSLELQIGHLFRDDLLWPLCMLANLISYIWDRIFWHAGKSLKYLIFHHILCFLNKDRNNPEEKHNK